MGIVEFISATEPQGYEHPEWQSLSPMNIRRFDFALGLYGDKLAAFGGQPTIDSEKIEIYCPDTKCWKFVNRSIVPPERHFFTGVSVPEKLFEGHEKTTTMEYSTTTTCTTTTTTMKYETSTIDLYVPYQTDDSEGYYNI